MSDLNKPPPRSRLVTIIANLRVRRRTYNWILLGKMVALGAIPVLLLATAETTWCYLSRGKLDADCIAEKLHAKAPPPPAPTPKPPPAPAAPTTPTKPKPKRRKTAHAADNFF